MCVKMIFSNFVLVICIVSALINSGNCIRCFECVSRLGPGESDPCLNGDTTQLRRVRCIGPSVCALYHYQSTIPGAPSISHVTRGCQSLRYGGTCEDIFNDLRSRGEVLPGQHSCATCSSDLCNSSNTAKSLLILVFSVVSILFILI